MRTSHFTPKILCHWFLKERNLFFYGGLKTYFHMTGAKVIMRLRVRKARVSPPLIAVSNMTPRLEHLSSTVQTCALMTYRCREGLGTSGRFFTRSHRRTTGCWPSRTRWCKYGLEVMVTFMKCLCELVISEFQNPSVFQHEAKCKPSLVGMSLIWMRTKK